jgi:GNAT superfamily N-acetyltransferase
LKGRDRDRNEKLFSGQAKILNVNMIIPVTNSDLKVIHEIINDGASAYKGIIPEDRWHEPYMSEEELLTQIADGVRFWGFLENERMIAVMGIQDKVDVTLIRHAYVRTSARNKGIGGKLLQHLSTLTSKPILIGTWADATWAINFYKKHGFRLVSYDEKEKLLRMYWSIPIRQIETSVVLASADWVGGFCSPLFENPPKTTKATRRWLCNC